MGVLRLGANKGISIFYQLVSSTCDYKPSSTAAFLFSLMNKPGWGPVTVRPAGVASSYERAIYSCYLCEPTFGDGYDIYIASEASSNSNSYADLGHAYDPPSDHSFSSAFEQSWQEAITIFNQTKWKSTNKQTTIKDFNICSRSVTSLRRVAGLATGPHPGSVDQLHLGHQG